MARAVVRSRIRWDEQCFQCRASLLCITGSCVVALKCSNCDEERWIEAPGSTMVIPVDPDTCMDLLCCPAMEYTVVGTYYQISNEFRDKEEMLLCEKCEPLMEETS
jgi:hypothetical protein